MKNMIKPGKLITNDVIVEPHELKAINFLVSIGKTVELVKPSYTPNNKNADFVMDCVIWEMKSPQGNKMRTLEHAFKNAAKQSENIVIDLDRCAADLKLVLRTLEKLFNLSRRVKRMIIIARTKNMLDYRKKSC